MLLCKEVILSNVFVMHALASLPLITFVLAGNLVRLHTCIYVCVSARTCECCKLLVCMQVFQCACVRIRMLVNACVHACVRANVCVCACLCMCVC